MESILKYKEKSTRLNKLEASLRVNLIVVPIAIIVYLITMDVRYVILLCMFTLWRMTPALELNSIKKEVKTMLEAEGLCTKEDLYDILNGNIAGFKYSVVSGQFKVLGRVECVETVRGLKVITLRLDDYENKYLTIQLAKDQYVPDWNELVVIQLWARDIESIGEVKVFKDGRVVKGEHKPKRVIG